MAKSSDSLITMLDNLKFGKTKSNTIIKKLMNIAIQCTYCVFRCRNKSWTNPELLDFWLHFSLCFLPVSHILYLFLYVVVVVNERGSMVVRAHASHAEVLWLEPDSISRPGARSLFTQQQMGTQWEHWGYKVGEERNWPPYLTYRWISISVLSNRHSPTYESIRDYLLEVVSQYYTTYN